MENNLSTATKLINSINTDDDDVKFLLLLTLCQMQKYTNVVDIDPSESFDIEEMLMYLDKQLGFDR